MTPNPPKRALNIHANVMHEKGLLVASGCQFEETYLINISLWNFQYPLRLKPLFYTLFGSKQN